VQTPVSLLACGNEKTCESAADEPSCSVVPDDYTESTQQDESVQQAASVDISTRTLKTLDELARDASDCRLCTLAEARHKVVFGCGDAHADLVFIGEAPGRDEDLQGEPFVGRAGQLLDRMLDAIELDRRNVYIMNTVKCRPPNNRDPKPDEVHACNLWFQQQLEILQPKLICLLGRVAAQTVLETDATLGSLRERWHEYHGIPVWVSYHPAYLLRSPQQKKKSWQDMTILSHRLRGLD